MALDTGTAETEGKLTGARLASRWLVVAIASGYCVIPGMLKKGAYGEGAHVGLPVLTLLQLLSAGVFFVLYYGYTVAEQDGRRRGVESLELRSRARSRALAILSVVVTLAALYTALALEVGLWLPRSTTVIQAVLWGTVLSFWLLPSALLAWSTPPDAPPRPGDGCGVGSRPTEPAPPASPLGGRHRFFAARREWRPDVIPLFPRD